MKRDQAPNIIYLQWYGCDRMTIVNDDNTETPIPFEDYDEPYEVTWEHDRIYNTDVPYQRADLAETEITRLREALQWYADPENTAWQKDGFGGSTSNVMDDDGEVARAALEEADHDGRTRYAEIIRLRVERDEAIMLLRTVRKEVVPWSHMSMGIRNQVAHYLARIDKQAER